ncbi:MAG: HAD hydrolase-like protein [Candidatus Saccharimonadales bacterium]|jgi:phosphoglycolate phosphatase
MANLIFDFDGTIADSLEIVGDIFYEVTSHRELKPDEIAKIRQLPLKQVAKKLHVHWWQMPFLMFRGRKLMALRADEIPIFKGIPDVVKQLKANGHKLLIMSSNSSITISSVLHQKNLTGYFDKIYGGIGIFSKARALRRIILVNRLSRQKTYYIGDEERDVEASLRVNIHCIAVAWGFSDTQRLRDLHPYGLALQPGDIDKILKSANKIN